MTTSPEALARFLAQPAPEYPLVKDMPDAALYRYIEDLTGTPFRPQIKPRQHQLASCAFGCAQGSMLLFVGVRMGKTLSTLMWFEHLKRAGLARKGLVITPNPVLRPVWVNEAARNTSLQLVSIGTDPRAFVDALESDADILVASWSSLQQIFTKKQPKEGGKGNELVANKALLQSVAPLFDFVAIDEIHTAKEVKSLRYAIGTYITANAHWRAGLTGTPFGQDPFSLWAQAYLVDRGAALTRSFGFFREAFGLYVPSWRATNPHFAKKFIKKPWMLNEWRFDPGVMPTLREKLAPLMLVYENKEIAEQIDPAVVRLDMTAQQKSAYITVIKDAVEARKEDPESRRQIIHTLRQISSGYQPFTDDDGVIHINEFARNPKIEWLEELVEAGGTEFRGILFHMYTHTGDLLVRMLQRKGVTHSWLRGDSKQLKAVADFQSGKAQWIVAQAASGNAGLDLSMADYQCYVESPSAAIMRQQSEARALGSARQGRRLLMDDLICSTVDERALTMAQAGRDLLQEIIFDPATLL
jgi:hypothetical protein